jgi:uncharacterized protein (TIGR03086 family)
VDPVDQLARALDDMGGLVATVPDWAAATPCPDWDVRALVNHVVAGNHATAGILAGEPLPPPDEARRLQGADRLGDAPAEAFRESADALVGAFRRPGVLEATFPMPIGTVPGTAVLHLRLTETLVHGWDLARALGRAAPFPDEAAEQALRFSRSALADLPPGRTPFGPPRPVPDDAPPLDRLAALLGRDVR